MCQGAHGLQKKFAYQRSALRFPILKIHVAH